MKFYEWPTLSDFDNWHNRLKEQLGYPLFSQNQASGEIDESAPLTEDYTIVYEVENKWIALVEDEYADGLTETTLRLFERPVII